MSQDAVNKTIEDLVTRSRLGDQVASATLVVIGREAKKGQTRAITVREQVLNFIKKNPQKAREATVFGIETPEKELIVGDACLLKRNLHQNTFTGAGLVLLLLTLGEYSIGVLTHGPSLLLDKGNENSIVSALRCALKEPQHVEAFDVGNEHSEDSRITSNIASRMTPEEKKALQLGMIVGRARRLQAVSNPLVPLAILCPMTAWELGE